MRKSYGLAAEDLAYLWILLERANKAFHTKRSFAELQRFQEENYRHIHHAYYDIVTSMVSDETIETLSLVDTDEMGDFEERVRRLAEIIDRTASSSSR